MLLDTIFVTVSLEEYRFRFTFRSRGGSLSHVLPVARKLKA